MPIQSVAGPQSYPPLSFHFSVRFAAFPWENGFQQVDGLSVDVPEFTYQEGGENTFTHRFPDRLKYSDLKLKRGILQGSALILWCKAAIEEFTFVPMDIEISLKDEKLVPLQMWLFKNAWPRGWSVDGFDAMSNKVAIENLTIAYQKFHRIPIPVSL